MAINRSFDESHTKHAERIKFNQEYSFRPGRHLRTCLKSRRDEVK